MEFGARVQRWWQRVRGEGPPPPAEPGRPAAEASAPTAARTVAQIEAPGAAGELTLSVEGKPRAAKAGKEPGQRSAGFDPYANAGGHAKPRGWDNVPRK